MAHDAHWACRYGYCVMISRLARRVPDPSSDTLRSGSRGDEQSLLLSFLDRKQSFDGGCAGRMYGREYLPAEARLAGLSDLHSHGRPRR